MTSQRVSTSWACVVTAAAVPAVLCEPVAPGLLLYYGLVGMERTLFVHNSEPTEGRCHGVNLFTEVTRGILRGLPSNVTRHASAVPCDMAV